MRIEKTKGIKFNRKLVVGTIVVILIIGSSASYKYVYDKKNKNIATESIETKASTTTTITGSGTIKPANKFQITSLVSGRIKRVYFKEGDKVQVNDLMLEIDSLEAESNAQKIKESLDQTRLDLNSNLVEISKLTVKSPINGQVSNILVKKGDIVSVGDSILTIADKSKLKLTVPFNSSQIKNIFAGAKATVYLATSQQIVEGTVGYISSSPHATSQNAVLYNVEIVIDNPGALKEGEKANAEINSSKGAIESPEIGILSYADSYVVKSNTSGKVESIDLKEDQYVGKDSTLLILTNDTVSSSRDVNNLKIQSLQEQLVYAKRQLEYYKIYAPMSGVIAKQDLKSGETVKVGDQISYLIDLDSLELIVSIDDTDIANITLGQKVSIKVDALGWTADKPLEGEIKKISVEGTTVNGTTTYPVTISLPIMPELKSGMNASIDIKIDKK